MSKLSIISTSRGERIKELEALLDSVSKIEEQDKVFFVFYDQCPAKCEEIVKKSKIKNIIYIRGEFASLSFARNQCLSHITDGYICFSDDDAIYDPDSYKSFSKTVELSKGSVYIGQVINLKTGDGYGGRVYPDSELVELCFEDMIYFGMSLALYVPYIRDMKFDIDLGAGAKYGGSEETDLLLRYREIRPVYYSANLKVKHPNEDSTSVSFSKYYNYSIGYSLVLLRAFKNNKKGVVKTLSKVFYRTLGGVFLSKNRMLYISRFLGLVVGGLVYVKEKINT